MARARSDTEGQQSVLATLIARTRLTGLYRTVRLDVICQLCTSHKEREHDQYSQLKKKKHLRLKVTVISDAS